jgi:hypothetical protein
MGIEILDTVFTVSNRPDCFFVVSRWYQRVYVDFRLGGYITPLNYLNYLLSEGGWCKRNKPLFPIVS